MVYFSRLGFIFSAVLILLTACGVDNSPTTGAKVGDLYRTPESYQDHRDQQQLFTHKGHKIAYTDTGVKDPDAKILILLHGVPTSSWMYRKVISGLQKNMRVITIDFLGYGSSDKPEANDTIYSHEAQAERTLALLEHLGVDQFSVLMHDMGGLVAWELMRSSKDRIKNLVVLNTVINKTGFENPDIDARLFTRQMMKAYNSPVTSAAVLKKTFDDLGLVNEHELDEAECYGYVAPIKEGSDGALFAFYSQLDEKLFARLEENRLLFKEYTGETLILWGAKDKTLTTKQIPILQETLSIPDQNIHIYPDNAHFLAEEIPVKVVDKVTEFLKSE